MMEPNPITGVNEPYFPQKDRMPRLVSGYAVIVLMVGTLKHPPPLLSYCFRRMETATLSSVQTARILHHVQRGLLSVPALKH